MKNYPGLGEDLGDSDWVDIDHGPPDLLGDADETLAVDVPFLPFPGDSYDIPVGPIRCWDLVQKYERPVHRHLSLLADGHPPLLFPL
jgi:hypothetical protein